MRHSSSHSGWNWLVVPAIVIGLSFAGCGGSEEAMQEEGMEEQPLGEQAEPAPAKDAADDALTSFIGAAPAKDPAPAQTAPAQQPGQLSAYEKQIEALRTENTTLKQRLVKLEQDNRTLNTMVAENESKIQAARDRADSLEKVMMARPVAAAAPAPGPAQTATQPVMVGGDEAALMGEYERALQSFNSRRYDDAIATLDALLSGGVQADLADNCHYWIGESNFAKRRYKEAIGSFEKVLGFKVSEKKGDATYMMAQSYERLGDKVKAKEGYEKVVKDYPLSNVVKKAKERWARL